MANVQNVVEAVAAVTVKLDTLIAETTNADNRFEAKLADLGAQIADLQAQIVALQNQAPAEDTQPAVDAINTLGEKIDVQIAAQQVSGI